MPSSVPAPALNIPVTPLTTEAFSAFGTVIQNPINDQTGAALPPNVVRANQGSAIKILDVTQMINFYASAPSQWPAKVVMNMFVCSPRPLRREHSSEVVTAVPIPLHSVCEHASSVDGHGQSKTQLLFDVKILERHPFTPQTFLPIGLDHDDSSACYLVIVAPTQESNIMQRSSNFLDRARTSLSALSRTTSSASSIASEEPGRKGSGPPDLHNIRAFLANGSQAVTYGAGTWHAPMVVLGTKKIDFVVVQYANGVADEDCQEIELHADEGRGVSVVLEVPTNQLSLGSELKAKM